MEGNHQNQPLLPPNYISLADLKERWMIKQKREKQRREKHEEEEPQLPNLSVQFPEPKKLGTFSNPNRHIRSPFCGNYGGSKSKIDTIGEGIYGEEKEKGKDGKRMKKKGKKKKKQNSVIEGTTNPAMNGECGEERENEVKGDGQAAATERPLMGDRTVEISERWKKLSMGGGEWMSNVRSGVAVEASRGMYRAYRGMGKNMREDGLIWVKKEEVSDQNLMIEVMPESGFGMLSTQDQSGGPRFSYVFICAFLWALVTFILIISSTVLRILITVVIISKIGFFTIYA